MRRREEWFTSQFYWHESVGTERGDRWKVMKGSVLFFSLFPPVGFVGLGIAGAPFNKSSVSFAKWPAVRVVQCSALTGRREAAYRSTQLLALKREKCTRHWQSCRTQTTNEGTLTCFYLFIYCFHFFFLALLFSFNDLVSSASITTLSVDVLLFTTALFRSIPTRSSVLTKFSHSR